VIPVVTKLHIHVCGKIQLEAGKWQQKVWDGRVCLTVRKDWSALMMMECKVVVVVHVWALVIMEEMILYVAMVTKKGMRNVMMGIRQIMTDVHRYVRTKVVAMA
jgi:hypothetical protein